MTTMKRALLLAAMLAFATTACGSVIDDRLTSDGHAGVGISSSDRSGTDEGDPARAARPSGSASANAGHIAAGRTHPVPSPASSPFNTMPLSVSLDKTCARRGDTVAATAVTLPVSKLAFAAYYFADNDFVPDIHYVPAETNPTGSYTWRFVIRPNTPYGDARVTVVSSKDKRGGAAEASFYVATSC